MTAFFKNLTYLTALGAVLFVLVYPGITTSDSKTMLAEWQNVPVMPPLSRPAPSDQSIQAALAMYGIALPANADFPVYVASLVDRGATIRSTNSPKLRVEIGPAAFESWAILGSTLAHELEVHCQQNFMLITLLDMFGFDGTSAAERTAYEYEIAQGERFGLTYYDKRVISSTMEYYFPASSPKLGNWLAARVLK